MGKYKHKAVKELSDQVKEHKKNRVQPAGRHESRKSPKNESKYSRQSFKGAN